MFIHTHTHPLNFFDVRNILGFYEDIYSTCLFVKILFIVIYFIDHTNMVSSNFKHVLSVLDLPVSVKN